MAELESISPSLGLTSGGLNRETSFSQLFELITPYRTEKGVKAYTRDPMSPIVGMKRTEEYLSDSSEESPGETRTKKQKITRNEKASFSLKGNNSQRKSKIPTNLSQPNVTPPNTSKVVTDKTSTKSRFVSKELVALRCHYDIWVNSDVRMTRSQLTKKSNETYYNNDYETPTTSRVKSLSGKHKSRIDVLSKNKAQPVNASKHSFFDKDVRIISPSQNNQFKTPIKNKKTQGSIEVVNIDYTSDDERPVNSISVGSISPCKNVVADINPSLQNYISVYKHESDKVDNINESLNNPDSCKIRGKCLTTVRRSKRNSKKSNTSDNGIVDEYKGGIEMKYVHNEASNANDNRESEFLLADSYNKVAETSYDCDSIFSTGTQNKSQSPPPDHSNRDIEQLQPERDSVLCTDIKSKTEPLLADNCNSDIEVSQSINDVSCISDICINKSLPIVDYSIKIKASEPKNNGVVKTKGELMLFDDFKGGIETSLPNDGKVLCADVKSIIETVSTDDCCRNDTSLPGHEGVLTSVDYIVEIESSQPDHDISSTCRKKFEILQTNSGEMKSNCCSPVMLQSDICENNRSYDPLRYDKLSTNGNYAVSDVHTDDPPEEAMIVINEVDISSSVTIDQNESICDMPKTTDVCHTDIYPQESTCNSRFILETDDDLQEDSSSSQADSMSPQFNGFDDSHFYASVIYNLMHHICLSSDEEDVTHFQSINFRGKKFLLKISAKEIRDGDDNVAYCPKRNKEDTSILSSIRSPDDCGETDMFIDLYSWPCSPSFQNEADLMKNDTQSLEEINLFVKDHQMIADDSSSLPETTNVTVDCKNSGCSDLATSNTAVNDEDQYNNENDNACDESSSSNNCPKQDFSMSNFDLRFEESCKNYRGPELEEVKTNENYCSIPALDGFFMMPKVASSWRISSSGWKSCIRQIVKKFCDVIGAKYTEDFTDTYNVLVVPANYKDRKTFKFMLSIASRAVIVPLEWVVHSLQKRIVPYPEVYLLYTKGGPSRCLRPDIPPPLIGTTVCTELLKEAVDKSDCSPEVEDLFHLCHLVGAVVVKSIDDFTFIQNEEDAPYPRFLLFKKEYQLTSQILSMCSRHSTVALSYKWLYDSIASYRRLPIVQYLCTTFFFTPDLFEKEYKIPKDLLVEDAVEDDDNKVESEDDSNHHDDNESS